MSPDRLTRGRHLATSEEDIQIGCHVHEKKSALSKNGFSEEWPFSPVRVGKLINWGSCQKDLATQLRWRGNLPAPQLNPSGGDPLPQDLLSRGIGYPRRSISGDVKLYFGTGSRRSGQACGEVPR